jgi:membrane-associated HD superfamily phosphohydrolase
MLEFINKFSLSIVVDPACQITEGPIKIAGDTEEKMKEATDFLDFNYERTRAYIAEARFYLNKLKECLQEAKDMLANEPEKMLTDSHSHRYQLKQLKLGILDTIVNDLENQLNKREQLLNHLELQDKGFFRGPDIVKKGGSTLMHYL